MAEESHTYVGKLLTNMIKSIPIDFDDLKRFWGFEDELNQLRQSLLSISDLVEDAEQIQERVVDVRRWLIDLKEVAYEADDLLSDLTYETIRLQVRSFSSFSIAGKAAKAKFRGQMVLQIKNVNQSLEDIQRQSLSLQLSSIQHNLDDMLPHDRLPTDLIFDNSVVGRKADVAKIVNLITSSCYEQLTVVSIEGTGGVGKTTLAKLVCQKVMALPRKPLDVEIWVRISINFSERKILGEMLQSLNPSMGGITDKDVILQQLKKELVRKKFLLVLDDVWTYNPKWWDVLKTLLSIICTNNGNAVLLTTRSLGVPFITETSSQHIHSLRGLSNDECWLILKERAFGNVTTPVPSKLVAIGREIANKCDGSPLIAKILGGIMGLNRYEETWLKIRDGVLRSRYSSMTFDLIVHHLPLYLKPCFAFCSIFPIDFQFRKEELIWLWMAEGIVESCEMGNKCFDALLASSLFQDAERDDYDNIILCKMHAHVHDFAFSVFKSKISSMYHLYAYGHFLTEMIFSPKGEAKLRTIVVGGAPNQDIWKMERLRSLLLTTDKEVLLPSSIGKMKHLRYLDVSISKIEELPESIIKLYNLQTLNLSNSSIKELPESITELFKLQTLNLSNSNIKVLPESISKLHNLQTLNVSNSNIKELPESISKLHNLQTLNVSNSNIKELPESISKLHNLQTLNVSNCNIKELPESITKLHNLQTLKFLECKELTELPRKKINNLINLKHIAFSYEHQMPFGLGKLNGLETLLFFVVGPDWGGSIEELECLNELKGDLKITRLEEVRDKKEVMRANLQGKAKIRGLGFEWSSGATGRSSRDEELLEGLQPHPNIQRINIKCYVGEKWPSWLSRTKSLCHYDSFVVINNVVDLRLEWCCNCVRLPRLGDLPHLKILKMSHMGKVKRVDNEFYGIDSEGSSSSGGLRLFPALKSLSISRMDNLIEWSSPSDGSNFVVFPCLENLSIEFCPNLTGFPMSDLSELVKLEIRDCEELRLLTDKKQSFPYLTSLSIGCCSKLTYLRNWLLSDMCFMELSVRRCEWLTFIPHNLGTVNCLTSLEVYCCRRLRYFPEEVFCSLTRLQNLSIGAFSERLDDFRYLNQIKELPCLEELEIWGSDFFGREMSFLPNQLQHLTVLRSLKIMGFTTMEALPEWLTNLQSLQSISLDYCRHLEWQSSATIIQHLWNLSRVNINCCPILEESKSDWLHSLDTTRIKVEFSQVSEDRVRLGY